MSSWINLSRALRREITSKVKRGPTPDEVARERVWASSKRANREIEAADIMADAEAANTIRSK